MANLTQTILRSAHTAVFMCFVWISEQTAIISLYNIKWMVFVTETESVYCSVRTEGLVRSELFAVARPQRTNPPILQPVDRQCVFCTFCLVLSQSLPLISFRKCKLVVTILLRAAPFTATYRSVQLSASPYKHCHRTFTSCCGQRPLASLMTSFVILTHNTRILGPRKTFLRILSIASRN